MLKIHKNLRRRESVHISSFPQDILVPPKIESVNCYINISSFFTSTTNFSMNLLVLIILIVKLWSYNEIHSHYNKMQAQTKVAMKKIVSAISGYTPFTCLYKHIHNQTEARLSHLQNIRPTLIFIR